MGQAGSHALARWRQAAQQPARPERRLPRAALHSAGGDVQSDAPGRPPALESQGGTGRGRAHLQLGGARLGGARLCTALRQPRLKLGGRTMQTARLRAGRAQALLPLRLRRRGGARLTLWPRACPRTRTHH